MQDCIRNIFIDNKVKVEPLTRWITSRYNKANLVFGSEAELSERFADFEPSLGKRSIFLTHSKGKTLKSCPGMKEPYLCCRIQVLSPISNCPMLCSYCFLQFYLNNCITTIYTNLEEQKEEIGELLDSQPGRLFRITTGELSDSLVFDRETNFSAQLIAGMRNYHNGILELKTKTSQIDHLLSLDHGGKVVISWSLNSAQIIKEEEILTASLEDRIGAAAKATKAGYLIGFHFDPLIYYASWERDYEDLIRYLFEKISARNVAWISLGTLRFAPGMEDEMKSRFPKSKIPYGEFIKAGDGKMRYIKPIRFKLYRKVLDLIRKYGGEEIFIYLCMEMSSAWEAVMGYNPGSKAGLDYLFAESLHQRFAERFPVKPCRGAWT